MILKKVRFQSGILAPQNTDVAWPPRWPPQTAAARNAPDSRHAESNMQSIGWPVRYRSLEFEFPIWRTSWRH